jgi:ferrous iron transport protein A
MASKLMAMGILPGSEVELIRRAPFGGAWYVRVDQQHIALRQAEVEAIIFS